MQNEFRATESWHYKFLTISTLFLQFLGVVFAILTKWDTPILIMNVMLFTANLLIFGFAGAFITSKVSVSSEGFEHTSWFGARHYFTYWNACSGYGLVMTPRIGYNLQFLYFSKNWRQKGLLSSGMIDWEYCGELPQHDSHPKIGKDFCQIQYSDKVWLILKENMPKEMGEEIEQQLKTYRLR